MNAQKRKERIKLINKTFERLSWCCENDSHRYFEKFFDLCKAEEKGHRNFMGDSVPDGLTVTEAAKYYACFDVFRSLVDKTTPEPKYYLWTRKAIFMGYALLHHFAREIHKEFTPSEILEFCQKCDYVALNQNPAIDETEQDNEKVEVAA